MKQNNVAYRMHFESVRDPMPLVVAVPFDRVLRREEGSEDRLDTGDFSRLLPRLSQSLRKSMAASSERLQSIDHVKDHNRQKLTQKMRSGLGSSLLHNHHISNSLSL